VSGLPDFENPPVIETVLGVQFVPLDRFMVPHFGLYWQKIKQEYDHFQVFPPLANVIEEFGSAIPSRLPQISVELINAPELRCWFLDKSENNLIQVQRDRFIHNWKKVKGDEPYPHYENIRPKFKAQWLRFCEFLAEEGLGTPEINQCEIVYVNHIEFGGPIMSAADVPKLVRAWSATSSGDFLPKPEKVGLSASYVIKEKKGRLHISLQPVIRSRDAMEVLQLNLAARGRPASSHIDDILEWLDLGREWIVRGFTDFTTPEMHQIWRRKHDR